jgi:hypothetical protein
LLSAKNQISLFKILLAASWTPIPQGDRTTRPRPLAIFLMPIIVFAFNKVAKFVPFEAIMELDFY